MILEFVLPCNAPFEYFAREIWFQNSAFPEMSALASWIELSHNISFSKKRGTDMRRLMMLNVLALSVCSVILLGCGSDSKHPVSQSDIPDLIGKWEGLYPSALPRQIKVQILNGSLEGNMSFRNPHEEGAFPTTVTPFKGKIENGELVLWEKNLTLNLKLRKDGKGTKLEGNYHDHLSQYSGTLTIEKTK